MHGERFALQIDWLGQLLRDAHHPSLGEYKERLLRNVIADSLPAQYGVGTGFVLFPTQQMRDRDEKRNQNPVELPPHELSRQLDVIVYDRSTYPTVFQDDDFVVLRPEAVRAIVEVKGSLSHRGVDDAMDLLLDFGQKWKTCHSFYKSFHGPKMRQPYLFAMAWAIQTDKNGRARINCTSLRKRIVSRLKELELEELPRLPILDAFMVYRNCEVSSVTWFSGLEDELEFGFGTHRGRFVRYGEDGTPSLSGDKTIASLLARIHYSLGSPFNTAFAYVDQTRQLDVLPHEHDGYETWLTGVDDIRLTSPLNFEEDED